MTANRKLIVAAAIFGFVASSGPAQAGWKLVPAGLPQALGPLTATPSTDWNRSSSAPGKQGMAWTHDGFDLNRFEAYADIPSGQSIFKDRAKKQNPMPKFDKTMLLPDLADFFEKSFRVQYRVSDFAVEELAPTTLSGLNGIRIRYNYSLPNDDLVRRGEAILTVKNSGLFLVNFQAPAIHYFDAGIEEFRNLAGNLVIK